jgi:hypothetical protein
VKIKRKPLRPAKGGRPAYVIGWSFALPTTTDLKFWFDLEYGGPLKIEPEPGPSPTRFRVSHAIWNTTLLFPLPQAESQSWKDQLEWGHGQAAILLQRHAPPSQACDTQLFSSRLARGLTLLSEGTAYDVGTGSFLNPSDWKDRPLAEFHLDEHVAIIQPDSEGPTAEWFRTMGLSKFGLDELETARPRGLPGGPTRDILLRAAVELLMSGQSPKVGSMFTLSDPRQDIHVLSHRTIPHAAGPLSVRLLRW